MPSTYTLITGETLTTTATSYSFTAIPSTFTDLVVRISGRSSNSGSINENIIMRYNTSNGNYSVTWLRGEVAGFPASGRQTNVSVNSFAGNVSGSTSTSNTFGSTEIYIPSYTVTQNRPSSHFSVSESNDVNGPTIYAAAGLRSDTTAVSSIQFTMGGGSSYAIGSSFYLYGIKNS